MLETSFLSVFRVRGKNSIPITRSFYALPEILYPQGLAGEPDFLMVAKKGDFALKVAERVIGAENALSLVFYCLNQDFNYRFSPYQPYLINGK